MEACRAVATAAILSVLFLEMGACKAVATAAIRQAFGAHLFGAAYRVLRVEHGAHSPSMSAASLLQRPPERNAAEAVSTPSSQSAGDCLI